MKVNILGSSYEVVTVPDNDNYDGLCDTTVKVIQVAEYTQVDTWKCKKDLDVERKKTTRHEIVHAFFYESGIAKDFYSEETMAEWIASQFPKMIAAFKEADAI